MRLTIVIVLVSHCCSLPNLCDNSRMQVRDVIRKSIAEGPICIAVRLWNWASWRPSSEVYLYRSNALLFYCSAPSSP